jgi:membrane protein YqaA with SNARE-associated domain
VITDNIHKKIQDYVKILQRHADRFWYPPLIGFLAALDNLIIIIPNDGILISSSMLIPKRWFIFALSVTIGSTLGGLLLAALVELQGLPWILDLYPSIDETKMWALTLKFFQKYGLFLVFLVAVTPVVQQPAIILASLANTPLVELGVIIFVGRFIKFLIMAYLGSHAPRMLEKLWGLKSEMKEVGVKLD